MPGTDDELSGEEGMPDPTIALDERGFPIGTGGVGGGRLQATANPLQLKMERMKKEAEEKARADAKKAALQSRLAAFQTKGETESVAAAKRAAEEAAALAAAEAKAKVPAAEKVALDSRVVGMMRSGIVTKGRVIGRGAATGAGVRTGVRAGSALDRASTARSVSTGGGLTPRSEEGGLGVGDETGTTTRAVAGSDSDESDAEAAAARRERAQRTVREALARGAAGELQSPPVAMPPVTSGRTTHLPRQGSVRHAVQQSPDGSSLGVSASGGGTPPGVLRSRSGSGNTWSGSAGGGDHLGLPPPASANKLTQQEPQVLGVPMPPPPPPPPLSFGKTPLKPSSTRPASGSNASMSSLPEAAAAGGGGGGGGDLLQGVGDAKTSPSKSDVRSGGGGGVMGGALPPRAVDALRILSVAIARGGTLSYRDFLSLRTTIAHAMSVAEAHASSDYNSSGGSASPPVSAVTGAARVLCSELSIAPDALEGALLPADRERILEVASNAWGTLPAWNRSALRRKARLFLDV